MYERQVLFLQGLQFFRKFRVQLVAAQDGDDVGVKGPYERDVAQDVQDLVAHQFVLETGHGEAFRFRVNHCIFQSAPFAEAHFPHGFQFPGESDGSGGCDFLHVGIVVNDNVHHLGAQKGMGVDGGEGNAEAVIGKGGDEFFPFVNGYASVQGEDGNVFVLLFNARFFHHVHKGLGAAVAYRRFGRVHFNDTVVDVQGVEGGKEVFYSKYLGRSLFQGGGAHGAGNVAAVRRHLRCAGKIAPAEENACPRQGRMHGHGDGHAGMKAVALVRNRFPDCVLFSFHNETPFVHELYFYNYFIISFFEG